MSDVAGDSYNTRFWLGRRKDRGYYIITICIAVLCGIMIFLQRAGFAPSIITVAGISFSTSDFFMILAAGLCGYKFGMVTFVVVLISEIFRYGIEEQEMSMIFMFSLYIYLIEGILTGVAANKLWFVSKIKTFILGILLTLVYGVSIYFLTNYLMPTGMDYYQNQSLIELAIGGLPECMASVWILWLFYRFSSDGIKKRIGDGYLYTQEGMMDRFLARGGEELDKKLTTIMIIEAVVMAGIALWVANLEIGSFTNMNGANDSTTVIDSQAVSGDALFAGDIGDIRRVDGIRNWRRRVRKNSDDTEATSGASAGINTDVPSDVPSDVPDDVPDEVPSDNGRNINYLVMNMHMLILVLCLMVPVLTLLNQFIRRIISENIEKENKLKVSLSAAEAESKAKSSFLSSMSHEIRTPINAVLGMDEMILRETDDPQIVEYAENLRTAGNSLLGLINDVLDFSKIEAGKMDIIPVEYEFASVFNDLINMVKTRADSKGLELIVEPDPKIPSVLYGDEIRIKQVATNILTNAVKYTEEGSVTFKVEYTKKDDDNISLRFIISDTGIGIKQEDIGKLYSAFERIEEERNRTVEGTGLGMNITNRLLDLMDSSLEVESVYGEGSTFAFEIDQRVIKWDPIGDYKEALRRSIASRDKYHESFRAPDATILVVDDTPMNLVVFRGLVKQTKVRVEEATGGLECLDMIEKKKYDLIFLDHRMPDPDGIETLRRMRADDTHPNTDTPVIALTANAVSGAREEYVSAGFADYLGKPIHTDELEDMMIRLLPDDKVVIVTDEMISDEAKDKKQSVQDASLMVSGGEQVADETSELIAKLREVTMLDVDAGIEHCGSEDGYIEAIKIYKETISENYSDIKKFYQEKDIKNYTVKVHALKSSSRIVGALHLGDVAEKLEAAGNAEDMETIDAQTKNLLEEYEVLGMMIAFV